MKTRSIRRTMAALVVTGLVAAGCGDREDSSGDRDRNASRRSGLFLTTALDGVARDKVGDATISQPFTLFRTRQDDGSTLVGISMVISDKSGMRNEIIVGHLDSNGDNDFSFGSNGLRTFTLAGKISLSPTFSSTGQLIAPFAEVSSRAFNALQGIARFNVFTGQSDDKFGNGGVLTIPRVDVSGSLNTTSDSAGGVLISGFDPSGTIATTVVSRWTSRGLDTGFGTNGHLALEPPTLPDLAAGEGYFCTTPSLAQENDATLALFSCLTVRTVVDDAGQNTNEYRRVIVRRTIDRLGTVVGTDSFAVVDQKAAPIASGATPTIDDIQHGVGDNADYTFVTLNADRSRMLLKFTKDFTALVPGTDGPETKFPRYVSGPGEGPVYGLFVPRYIDAPLPRYVGIALNGDSGSTQLTTGVFEGDAMITTPRVVVAVGDLPAVTHDIEDVKFAGDGVFINLNAHGITDFDGVRSELRGRTGYLMIGTDGKVVEPYGSSDAMAVNPLNNGFFNTRALVVPKLFPAADGSLYAFGFEWPADKINDNVAWTTFSIEKFDARGNSVGRQTIPTSGFSPIFWRGSTVAEFDGKDAFYVIGWVDNQLGVAKISMSTGGFDPSYGVKGFAQYPLDDSGNTDFMWFGAHLQVNDDGAVDSMATQWGGDPQQQNDRPLTITTMRFAPNGSVDASKPRFVATVPQVTACNCVEDARALGIGNASVVDVAGRLLIPLPRLTWDEAPGNGGGFQPTAYSSRSVPARAANPIGGGELLRYSRNGKLDLTFGDGGIGGASLVRIGSDSPIGQPHIAVDTDGNIFMTFIGIEMSSAKNGEKTNDLFVDGEFAYAVMLNADGAPINFTPRKPNPAAKEFADLVGGSRTQSGTGDALPATPNQGAAVAAPAGQGTDVVVPADVVQISKSDVPSVTITGTPADRTIEVRWSVPASLATKSATYTVTATPGGKKCTTSTTSCVFKKLDAWTPYTFTIGTTIGTMSTSSAVPNSAASIPVKPVRIIQRGTRIDPRKLVTPASTGQATWKATGGCKVTSDGKTFAATKDAGLCTLSVTTAKAGKVPKTTRVVTVVVRAVAK